MQTISTSAAVALVRKNLEELDPNGSAMYGPTEVGSSEVYGDNKSLDSIIARNLPEAINAVHLAAPVQLLDGDDPIAKATGSVSTDGVLTITLVPSVKFLRLVSFKAQDSDIKVTDAIPAASPEGRKQLNLYIRGRADRPRLVLVKQAGSSVGTTFKYYSLTNPSEWSEDSLEAVEEFYIIQEQIFSDVAASYNISGRVRQNIIDYLTGLVMETYSDQRAQVYYQKASIYPTI